MTLHSSGAMYMSQIHGEFGRGYDLNAYRNVQWWRDDGSTGLFSGGNITMYEFYGKRSSPPPVIIPTPPAVTPGAQEFYSNGTFYVPAYNSITLRCDGAKGSVSNGVFVCGGGVWQGGNGGLAIRTYGPGALGVGGAVSVTVGPYSNSTALGVTGFRGADGYPGGGTAGGGDCGGGICTSSPQNGGPGNASGGDTNIVGGSAIPSGRVRFDWS
jgi:hypothetical protein